MTSWLTIAGGFALLLFVWIDVAWTALTLDGGGPITRVILRALGRLDRRAALARVPRLRSKLGAYVVIINAVAWIALSWVGWTLVFSAFEGTVVHEKSQLPADVGERIYFVGFTLSTLGVGDFVPAGFVWRVLTSVAASSGFVVITLAISYFVPLLSAVIAERHLAMMMSSLGESPVHVVVAGWHPSRGAAPLVTRMQELSQQLVQIDQQHDAYPVMHYFIPRNRDASLALGLTRMQEALVLLEHGVAEELRPDASELGSIHWAIDKYTDQLFTSGIATRRRPPPLPSLDALEEEGIPSVERSAFEEGASRVQERRGMLADYLERHGWSWRDV